MSHLRHAPVAIKLYEQEVQKADLLRELKIDRNRLDHELLHQPGKFAWWASLQAEVSSEVEKMEGQLEELFAELFQKYSGKGIKTTEVKHKILLDRKYQHLQHKLWRWHKSERFLKGAVRAFEHRMSALQSVNANIRSEREKS